VISEVIWSELLNPLSSLREIFATLRPSHYRLLVFLNLIGKLPLHGSQQLSNPGVASAIVPELLTHPSCSHLGLSRRIASETFADGLAKTIGRLYFHTLPNGKNVLVDGAHNRGSAQALTGFIGTFLSSLPTADNPFNLAYILGLSHTPPKQPHDTPTPLFSPSLLSLIHPNTRVNAAVPEPRPPDDVPRTKAEPPRMICDAIKAYYPDSAVRFPTRR
jgi:hypothetical protein